MRGRRGEQAFGRGERVQPRGWSERTGPRLQALPRDGPPEWEVWGNVELWSLPGAPGREGVGSGRRWGGSVDLEEGNEVGRGLAGEPPILAATGKRGWKCGERRSSFFQKGSAKHLLYIRCILHDGIEKSRKYLGQGLL